LPGSSGAVLALSGSFARVRNSFKTSQFNSGAGVSTGAFDKPQDSSASTF